jgi:hypothetical protein
MAGLTLTFFVDKRKNVVILVEDFIVWRYDSLKNKGVMADTCVRILKIKSPRGYIPPSGTRLSCCKFYSKEALIEHLDEFGYSQEERELLIVRCPFQ